MGADAAGTAASKVAEHDGSEEAHGDIRLLVKGLTDRLNALADSDDTTLDQMSELVAYIKSNKSLIDGITTGKVSVTDIVDNLTTGVANKPLSAKQGVALKALIDKIVIPTKVSQLTNDSGYLTSAPVTSVNGKKGAVVLSASDVGALPNTTPIPSIPASLPANGGNADTVGGKTAEQIQQAAVSAVGGVPEYVVAAAEAVIDKVAAAQGSRTITLAAITDLHYGSWGYYEGITDYRKGVDHACQALKYIDERIKLDAVAVLGDYTDGMASTQQGTAIADFKGVNAVLDKLRFAPNLRLQGNHDFVAEKSPLAYRYIGAYNDGSVEWGNALGGYFYKDFSTQKLRVICLNTSETGNGGVYCSVAQYEWFVRALDLSDKADASEWGILILSHIPLDMWTEGGKYRFAYILDAYQKGGSWSDDAVSCDFAEKNAASLVGCIHGHVHNFKVDKLYLGNIADSSTQIDVWRMATPNACFGLENKEYTGYQEATAYTKTADSASDTAFCVYCIDLDNKTIKAICYGAGFDRTLNYADGTVIAGTTYSVTNRLDKVINSNKAGIVAEGSAYTATLSTEGELTSVTVTMGGVDITATAYSNGVVTIPKVTGDVVITATAVVVELVNVLAASTDVNGNVYNGVGWKKDTRWSGSSNAEQDYSNVYLSGWIPCDGKTGTVYMKNVDTTSRLLIWYFQNKGAYRIKRELSQGAIPGVVYGGDGNVASFTLEGGGGDKFFRIECGGFSADSIVTINQPID